MAAENIRVYFQPLASFAGKTFHHETLVYTDSRGQQFYATAYAPRRPDGEDSDTMSGSTKIGSDLAGAAGAAATNGTSPFGSIVTQWGRPGSFTPDGPRKAPVASPTRKRLFWIACGENVMDIELLR